MKQVLETAFFALASKIGQKTKTQNYLPNMALVIVNTHQKMEFYSRELQT